MELATIALVAWERLLSMLEASAVPFVTDLKLSPSFALVQGRLHFCNLFINLFRCIAKLVVL